MDYTIRIGGEAGQGVQTVGDTLAKVFARTGYHVFTHQDYESRVRGGHNFYQIRFSDRPVFASRDSIDLLIAFDRESITLHERELSPSGMAIYDSADLRQSFDRPGLLDVPFSKLASEHGGSGIMANTVAVGAALGIIDPGSDTLAGILDSVLSEAFASKGGDIVTANIKVAAAGRLFAKDHCGQCSYSLAGRSPAKMLISGTEAIGLGALASDCRFYAAYPMTPATGIMNYLAGREKDYSIIVEQAEDEISAVNMALGASYAGVRAMTGTSGGGFALMVEGLSLAAMTETPVVIALGQRPGPATGLPTRTEQGDLQFVLYTAHGEFPRLVFSPGTPEQAFHLTNKAFDLSEKYQIPAIVIFDQYLGDSCWTYEGFDMKRLVFKDYRLRGEEFSRLEEYRRHALTGSGISPLGIPGDAGHTVVTDSDEHDEDGHIIEDAATRVAMVDKRLFRKLAELAKEITPPELFGPPDAEILLAGWGSTWGIMREAVEALSGRHSIAMLHFSEIWPFPPPGAFDYPGLLRQAKKTICIEQNATGQFARLLRSETGYEFTDRINRYDGRPFTLETLTGEINARIG